MSSLVYDGEHLFFSDSLRGTIERVGLDGGDRTVLRSHLGAPLSLAVSDQVRADWSRQSTPFSCSCISALLSVQRPSIG